MSRRKRKAKGLPNQRPTYPLHSKGRRPIRPARDAGTALMRQWRAALKYRRLVRNRLVRMSVILRLIPFVPATDTGNPSTERENNIPRVSYGAVVSRRTFGVLFRYVLRSVPRKLYLVFSLNRCLFCFRAHSTLSCHSLLQAEIRFHRTGEYLGLSDPQAFLRSLEAEKLSRLNVVWMIIKKVVNQVNPLRAPVAVVSTAIQSAGIVSTVLRGRGLTNPFAQPAVLDLTHPDEDRCRFCATTLASNGFCPNSDCTESLSPFHRVLFKAISWLA